MATSGDHEGNPTGKQEPEVPITIMMSSELLFKQQGSGTLSRGPAFSFVKALQAVNAELGKVGSNEFFVVKLVQDNPDDQTNTFSQEHNLGDIVTPLMVEDSDVIGALQKNKTHLYLSTPDGSLVPEVIDKAGIAAADMHTPEEITEVPDTQLRVVFDGDAVLFSNESELVFKGQGLQGYMGHEREHVNDTMNQGPFKEFMKTLVSLQGKFMEKNNPIRTYLVTSRDAGNAGFRALNTLKTWGVEINEAYFLSGSSKGPVLQLIRPHIFFDDQLHHVQAAANVGVVGCHVKYGTYNS